MKSQRMKKVLLVLLCYKRAKTLWGSLASCGRLSIGPTLRVLPRAQPAGGGNQPPRRLSTCPTSMAHAVCSTVILVIALTLPLCAQVKITQQDKGKISVEIDGKPFTDFYVGPENAKPYLHPLRTADGKVVTRGFPMVTDIPGEAHDHPHHRGLWFTH